MLYVPQADTKYITNIHARICSGPTSEVLSEILSCVRYWAYLVLKIVYRTVLMLRNVTLYLFSMCFCSIFFLNWVLHYRFLLFGTNVHLTLSETGWCSTCKLAPFSPISPLPHPSPSQTYKQAFPDFHLLVISSWIEFWFINVVLKYLNCFTISKDLLSALYIVTCPPIWSREMTVYFFQHLNLIQSPY